MASRKPKSGVAMPAAPWRNRITRYGEEAPDQLLAHEKNWRIHPNTQQAALRGVLQEVGLVQNVIISERSGKCLDGHLRIQMAISEGQPTIPITYVDITEEEENLILASLDPLSSLALPDTEKLMELLGGIDVGNEALDQMFSSLAMDSANVTLKDEPVDGETESEDKDVRNMGERSAQIKPVLYVDQIAVFEQALRRTGETNRGKALMMVCNAYLHQTEGQLDILSEGYAPLESLVRA
jgi:hypothetical protein